MGKEVSCKIYELCGRDCTHCTAEEAKKKAKKMQPRKTTIFEGAQAEKLAAKGMKNYETYYSKKVAENSFRRKPIYEYSPCCGAAQGYKKFVTAYTGKAR